MDDKPSATGFSLTPTEIEIIAAESQRTGINNNSATLRKIIREWHEFASRNVSVADPVTSSQKQDCQ